MLKTYSGVGERAQQLRGLVLSEFPRLCPSIRVTGDSQGDPLPWAPWALAHMQHTHTGQPEARAGLGGEAEARASLGGEAEGSHQLLQIQTPQPT